MAENEVFLTLAGLRKLETDLAYLREIKRKEVSTTSEGILHSGGLLASLEQRIRNLEYLRRHAKLIDARKMATDQVRVGHRVKLQDLATGENVEFLIVGSVEADPAQNRISHRSPVAQAILGCKVGEVVDIEVPAGRVVYKILSIDVGYAR
ncbi:MAG: transcription elongation factor GreA [Firmicutes bacterium]|nr:transcription elongation factor GreA [Bacillota bacterium]